MLDAMMAAIFVFLGAVAVCFITVAAVGFIRMGSASDGMCAPSRRANITASKPQPQRRVMVQLGPPAGWREPQAQPVCALVVEDAEPLPAQRRVVQPEPAPPPAAVPEELPVAVPVVPQGIPVDWPTRVVRPVPLSRR